MRRMPFACCSLKTATMAVLLVSFAAFAHGAALLENKRPVSVEDLIAIRRPSQPSLSPDGRTVAFVLSSPALATNTYSHDLYIVSADGAGSPRLLAKGADITGNLVSFQRQSPVWSPDSERLVFVAPDASGSEIRSVRVDTAKVDVLVSSKSLGPDVEFKPVMFGTSLAYSPDGRWLAFLASRKSPEAPHESPMHAIEAHEDWVPAQRQFRPRIYQLYLLEMRTGRVSAMTGDGVSVASFDWSPDSTQLALSIETDPNVSSSYMTTDLHVLDAATGALRTLVTQPGMDEHPRWSPDGKLIAFSSQRGQEDWTYATTLGVVAADGSAPARYVRQVLDTIGGSIVPVRWSLDGNSVDVRTFHDLSRHIFRVKISEGTVSRLTPRRDRHYSDFSYSQDGRRLAFVAEGTVVPPDIHVADANASEMQPLRLTECNPQWSQLQVPTLQRVMWRSSDGRWDLNGLLLKPSTAAAQPLPLLTHIEGGAEHGSAGTQRWLPLSAAGVGRAGIRDFHSEHAGACGVWNGLHARHS